MPAVAHHGDKITDTGRKLGLRQLGSSRDVEVRGVPREVR